MPLRNETIGKHFGKFDLERRGEFAEMSYLHGMKYTTANPMADSKYKGHQMYPGFPKSKAALQDCYFDSEFKRIFIGEAYRPLYKFEAQDRLKQKSLFLRPRGFANPGFPKQHSTPGDHYGTFAGIYPAFSPRIYPPKPREPEKPNVLTSPGKKGGTGVVDVCINKYPEYISGDKYDVKEPIVNYKRINPPLKAIRYPNYFHKNPYPEDGELWKHPIFIRYNEEQRKLHGEFLPGGREKPLGGHKGGCFDPFPVYLHSRYIDPWRIFKDNRGVGGNKIFFPPASNRTRPMFSVANLNVDKKMNADNYVKFKPVTYKREILS